MSQINNMNHCECKMESEFRAGDRSSKRSDDCDHARFFPVAVAEHHFKAALDIFTSTQTIHTAEQPLQLVCRSTTARAHRRK